VKSYPYDRIRIDVENLRSLLLELIDGSVSAGRLSELVQLSRAIVQSHLEHLRPSITLLSLRHGLTTTDLAYDCIADAFARDSDNNFTQMKNFVESLRDNPDALPNHEIFFAFKSFITRIADVQLARLYAQADPSGAKIHRNLRECLKNSPLLSLVRDFRGMVVQPANAERLDHLEQFPIEELEREFLARSGHSRTTPEMIQTLYDVLTEQSCYRRSIPLFDVMLMFKKLYRDEYEPPTVDDTWQSLEGLQKTEIEELRREVETVLKEKILLTYFARGKLERKQAEAMAGAFHDILWDWCFSEDRHCSLCEYLQRHIQIDESTYESTLRTKMEYLLKVARDEFAARLMKEM
jgi:hypothetical protein